GEGEGGGLADAAGGARHQRDLVLDLHGSAPPGPGAPRDPPGRLRPVPLYRIGGPGWGEGGLCGGHDPSPLALCPDAGRGETNGAGACVAEPPMPSRTCPVLNAARPAPASLSPRESSACPPSPPRPGSSWPPPS